jgi:hypothetical protein
MNIIYIDSFHAIIKYLRNYEQNIEISGNVIREFARES